MPHYRFYFLDHSGHVAKVEEFHASGDAEARARAETLCPDKAWELWSGPTLVARPQSARPAA